MKKKSLTLAQVRKAVVLLKQRNMYGPEEEILLRVRNTALFNELVASGLLFEKRPGVWDLVSDAKPARPTQKNTGPAARKSTP